MPRLYTVRSSSESSFSPSVSEKRPLRAHVWYFAAAHRSDCALIRFLKLPVVFVIYDCTVQKRQDKVEAVAERTNAIVTSLFPQNVRERIMKEAEDAVEKDAKHKWQEYIAPKHKLEQFLGEEANGMTEDNIFGTKPIADL